MTNDSRLWFLSLSNFEEKKGNLDENRNSSNRFEVLGRVFAVAVMLVNKHRAPGYGSQSIKNIPT